MLNERIIPELRFDGFSSNWNKRLLGDILEVWSAARVHKNEWKTEGVPFFRSSDIMATHSSKDNLKAFISEDLYKTLSAISGKVIKDDVLVTGGGSIAMPYLVPNDDPLYFKDGDLILLSDRTKNDIIGQFLYYFYLSPNLRKYVASITHIGTISHYTIEQAKATPAILPNVKEQAIISNFIKIIDETISLKKQQYERTASIKKAMLQKMFPQNGSNVPEIRFIGFTDAWEQRRLGDVCDLYDNLRIPVAEALREPGTTPYYGANGIQGYVNGFTHNGEYVLIAEDGASDLVNYPVRYVFGKVWVNNHAHVLQGRQGETDTLYLSYALAIADIQSVLVGGTRAKLNASALKAIITQIPSFKEQNKIGNFFTTLDNLIILHQREIEKLCNIKSAFLHKMFV